jgi:hypothetical protein
MFGIQFFGTDLTSVSPFNKSRNGSKHSLRIISKARVVVKMIGLTNSCMSRYTSR